MELSGREIRPDDRNSFARKVAVRNMDIGRMTPRQRGIWINVELAQMEDVGVATLYLGDVRTLWGPAARDFCLQLIRRARREGDKSATRFGLSDVQQAKAEQAKAGSQDIATEEWLVVVDRAKPIVRHGAFTGVQISAAGIPLAKRSYDA
jgi:hypothetical protein